MAAQAGEHHLTGRQVHNPQRVAAISRDSLNKNPRQVSLASQWNCRPVATFHWNVNNFSKNNNSEMN